MRLQSIGIDICYYLCYELEISFHAETGTRFFTNTLRHLKRLYIKYYRKKQDVFLTCSQHHSATFSAANTIFGGQGSTVENNAELTGRQK